MFLLYISLVQLSRYKVFLGHSIQNSILSSSWLIFKLRGKITILNMFYTLKMLKSSYILIRYVINMGFPFWFINFDLTKEDIVKKNAFSTGEFYVTRRWIRGLVSNYYEITESFRNYLTKKEFINSNKVRDIFDKWFFTRFSWPRGLFISSSKNCYIMSKEAFSAGVPSIGLVDIDVKSHIYNIPVACNDDSTEAISFMHCIIAQYIIKCKYKKVIIWYYFNRNVKRKKNIIDWLSIFVKKKKKKYKLNLERMLIPNFENNKFKFKSFLRFFFGRSYLFSLSLPKKNNFLKDKLRNYDDFYSLKAKWIYNRINVTYYKSLSYKYKIRFKRRSILNKIEGLSVFKSFLNNYIKLVDRSNSRIYKRIKVKRRVKLDRKKVGISFKFFFYFIFFFYLNKFNIIIDSYNRKNFSLPHLVKLFKQFKIKRKYINKNVPFNKYIFSYVFRYKSKKKFRRRKRNKMGSIFEPLNKINSGRNSLTFFLFYWKFLIIFLGLKLRSRPNKFKNFNNLTFFKKKI